MAEKAFPDLARRLRGFHLQEEPLSVEVWQASGGGGSCGGVGKLEQAHASVESATKFPFVRSVGRHKSYKKQEGQGRQPSTFSASVKAHASTILAWCMGETIKSTTDKPWGAYIISFAGIKSSIERICV